MSFLYRVVLFRHVKSGRIRYFMVLFCQVKSMTPACDGIGTREFPLRTVLFSRVKSRML